MNTGKVKFYNETKGYGFIVDDNTQEEYFTHATGLIDKVQENDSVEYELEEGRKGLNAINVKVIKYPSLESILLKCPEIRGIFF